MYVDYLDWNIYTVMKKQEQEPYKSIAEILAKNQHKYVLPYSDAHIKDLHKGYQTLTPERKELVHNDLKYLSGITDNHYIYQKKESENIDCSILDPEQVFKDIGATMFDGEYFENLLDEVLNDFTEDEEDLKKLFESLFNLFKLMPATGLRETMVGHLSDELSEELYPRMKQDANMYNMLIDSIDYMSKFATDSRIYKEQRTKVKAEMVDLNVLKESGNPFDVLQEIYPEEWDKRVFSVDETSVGENKHLSFNYSKFMELYLTLDMSGFESDKLKGKNNISNLMNDMTHAFFGGSADVFVTNDFRAREKTKEVYKKLNISTAVLSPEEYLELLQKRLSEEQGHWLSRTNGNIHELIKSGEVSSYDNWLQFSYGYDSYFNCVFIENEKRKDFKMTYTRYMSKFPVGRFYKELQSVTEFVYQNLGDDSHGRTGYRQEAVKGNEPSILGEWKLNDEITIYLKLVNNQLYLAIITEHQNLFKKIKKKFKK